MLRDNESPASRAVSSLARVRRRIFDRAAAEFIASYYRGRGKRLALFTAGAWVQALLMVPVLLLLRRAFDVAIPGRNVRMLVLIALAIVLLRAVGSVLALMLRSHVLRTTRGVVAELRSDLVARLYSLSRTFFSSSDLSHLHTRIVQDTERVESMSNSVVSAALPALFSALSLLVVMLTVNWPLVLLSMVLVPLMLLAGRVSGHRVKSHVSAFRRAFESFSKGVQFALQHIDLTRSKGYELDEVARQRAAIEALRASGHGMAMAFARHVQVQRTLTGIVGVTTLVAGGAAVANGSMTMGDFAIFYVAGTMLNGFVDTILGAVPEAIAGNESLTTLRTIMFTGDADPYHGQREVDFSSGLHVDRVSFAYEGALVLRNVSLTLRPGDNVVLVGPNGAGKTTLLHLLLGYYRPTAGALRTSDVVYDDIDIRALRRSIGVVPQHPAFFGGSIRDNIAYGSPGATDAEVIAAAQVALAHEFIMALPNGYATEIGEKGVKLSGGEGQRVAIARAILGKPRMLILDEPTNHLDRHAIGTLFTRLAQLSPRPILFTVTHDPNVVAFADKVLTLEDGVLTEATIAVASTPASEQWR